MAALAEIACTLFSIQDEPLMLKTLSEFICFLVGLFIASKLQDYIRVFVTSLFGGFLITTGGSIIFGKFPPQTKAQQNVKYLSHFVMMMIIAIFGAVYQNQ
jgi:putative Mn2+ efflux pump MntP